MGGRGRTVGHELGVHDELAVDAEADDHLVEAVDAAVVPEVHHLVVGELLKDGAVAAQPPVVVLEHHEHHLAGEPLRRDEQRDEPVAELVVHVARVPARREHHRGDAARVPDVAPPAQGAAVARAGARVVGARHGLDGHLVDGAHDAVLELARVRAHLLGGAPAGRVVQEHRRGGRVRAHVAAEVAHVAAVVAPVAAQHALSLAMPGLTCNSIRCR